MAIGKSMVPRATDVDLYSRRLASPSQVAALLSMNVRTIYSWIYGRKVTFYKIQGSIRIDLNELEAQLQNGKVTAIQS